MFRKDGALDRAHSWGAGHSLPVLPLMKELPVFYGLHLGSTLSPPLQVPIGIGAHSIVYSGQLEGAGACAVKATVSRCTGTWAREDAAVRVVPHAAVFVWTVLSVRRQ